MKPHSVHRSDKTNKGGTFHVHQCLSHQSKLIIYTTKSDWEWTDFLENGWVGDDVIRYLEIHRDEIGTETIIKDYSRNELSQIKSP